MTRMILDRGRRKEGRKKGLAKSPSKNLNQPTSIKIRLKTPKHTSFKNRLLWYYCIKFVAFTNILRV